MQIGLSKEIAPGYLVIFYQEILHEACHCPLSGWRLQLWEVQTSHSFRV